MTDTTKQIFCPLWGFIELTPLLVQILDTPEVQRLRDMKQLGATYLVFPSATHTRLEHSLGVCHLAKKMGTKLKKHHPEINISERFIELLQVAGLVHDIGHGPFSHLYDNYAKTAEEPDHEERGIKLFKSLCVREKIPLTAKEIRTIITMIDPKGEDVYNWKYQIIANKAHQIDVDKIDYIQRDSFHLHIPHPGEFSRLISGVRICHTRSSPHKQLAWNTKLQFDVFTLFNARYRLHKLVYTHHTIKAFEYLFIELLKYMRFQYPYMDISTLSDSAVIGQCYMNPTTPLTRAILQRQHPKLVGEEIIPPTSKKPYTPGFRLIVDMVIEETKLGFVSGNNKNPLNAVKYYNESDEKTKTLRTSFEINPRQTSFIVPKRFQERILRLYQINPTEKNMKEATKYWRSMLRDLI
jgi:deoxynucleoside triphosphate triphosphohydrolase SAMHD1